MKSFQEIYNEFFQKNKKYEVCNNSGTEAIFEEIYTAKAIGSMIHNIEQGEAAVNGITNIMQGKSQTHHLTDQWKQCCGSWIAHVMSEFGYVKSGEKNVTDPNSPFTKGAKYARQ